MKIAVTGASGHVGINLCKALVQAGYQVTALYRNETKIEPLKHLDITFCRGEIHDSKFVERSLQGADLVIHLAAVISIEGDPDGSVYKTNVKGPESVVNACNKLGIKRLFHFSSIHALDYNPKDAIVNETTPYYLKDKFIYKKSKALGELEALKGVDKGIHVSIFRPTSIIGINDYALSEVGEIFINLHSGKMPAVLNTGFDWIDVADIVNTLLNAIRNNTTASGEIYMLSGNWHALQDLVQMATTATGKTIKAPTLPVWTGFASLPFTPLIKLFMPLPGYFTYEALCYLTNTNRNISHKKATQHFNHSPRPTLDSVKAIYNDFAQRGLLTL